MKRKEIVEEFFKKGYLLEPSALSFLEKSKDYKKILENLKTSKFIISKDDLAILESPMIERLKIVRNVEDAPLKITTNDFVRFFNEKFEKCKKIILSRMNQKFVSISSLSPGDKNVWIIGMIREMKSNKEVELIVDDPTRSIHVKLKSGLDEELELDDVAAFFGDVEVENNDIILKCKKVAWPDVPLRKPKMGIGKICVISDLHLDEAPLSTFISFLRWFNERDIKYLFVCGDIGDIEKFEELMNHYITSEKIVFLIPGEKDRKEYPSLPIDVKNENVVSLSNPSIIELNGVNILLIHHFNLSMLKKRYLGKPTFILKNDPLVLDIVPDIILSGHTHESEIINYKSITIINPGSLLTEFKPVIVDLSTREYEQLRF